MRNAYITFFDNELESIDTQEIIDQFCAEKDIDNKFVKEIMHGIDSDHSNTITAAEFIENMCEYLDSEKHTKLVAADIIRELRWPSDEN